MLVTDNEEPLKPCIDVQSVNSHRVVVVKEQRSILAVWVVAQYRIARCYPLLRIAIACSGSTAAVQMNYASNVGLIRLRSTERVVNGQEVLLRQPVLPLHHQTLTAAGLEEWSGARAVESPDSRGRKIAMHLEVTLLHPHTVER